MSVHYLICQMLKKADQSMGGGTERIMSLLIYGQFLETLPTAVMVIDREGIILLANSRAHALFCYPAGEMPGTPVGLCVIGAREQCGANATETQGEPASTAAGVWMARRRDGDEFPVEVSINSVEQDGMDLQLFLIHDITNQKKTEAALMESEARYVDLYENAPDMYFSVNARTALIERCNNTVSIMLGYSKEEIIGRPVFDLYHPDCLEEVRNTFRLFQEKGEVHDRELRLEKSDGSPLDVSLSVSAVRDQYGNVVRSRSTLRDITERKRAEQALRESEKQVRQKLEAILAPDADPGELELSDIIDSEKLQKLMNAFYKLTKIGIGIIDLKGRVLVGTGWQEICTDFHRVHPDACLLCIESDLELTRNVQMGTFKQYKCKNNMWDISTPIMLRDKHVGNIFLGQFLYDDEDPDYETFRQQARHYGFSEERYIAALDRVPRWSHETVDAAMSFYATFAENVSGLGYSNIRLARALEERKRAETSLQKLNRELRAISDCNQAMIWVDDEQTLLETICHIICDTAGYRMSWVGYVENNAARTVRPVAWSGKEEGYLATAFITWDDTDRGQGPSGRAIRTGKSCLIQDFSTDPLAAPWRAQALERGYRSSLALPLKTKEAVVFGVLNIYATEPNVFTADEVRILEELADNLAFGITALHLRAEQKRMEEYLQESERKYRELLENLPTAVILHGADTRIQYWNTAALDLLGLSEEQISGRSAYDPVWHFVDDSGRRLAAEDYPVNLVIRNGASICDYVFGIVSSERKDPIWVYVNAFPEFDSDGKLQQVVVTFVDFTDRKRLEVEINQLNETLEQRVRDELFLNREKDHLLIQQSRLAAMGEMVHNIAHQWRQPLNSISVILGIIQDEFECKELTHDSLNKSVSRAMFILKQMSTTIDDFRNFFRPDREAEEFEVSQSVSHALSVIEATMKNSNIEITTTLEAGLRAFGYSSQFAQVVLNILTNSREAIQHHKIQGGKIEMHLGKDDHMSVLTIQDNGGGIPAEVLSRVFDPYFTTEYKTWDKGLSLYIAKAIIEKDLRGSLDVRNNDSGLELTIRIPVYHALSG